MIDQPVVERVLNRAVQRGAQWAEVFAEDRQATGASLDDGKVDRVSSGRTRGAGIRVVCGDTTGFAHTSDLSEQALFAAADAAAGAARAGGGGVNEVALSPKTVGTSGEKINPSDIAKTRKVELLNVANDVARQGRNAVKQVMANYGDSRRKILVANTDGVFGEDERVRTNFSVSVVASGDGGMQTGRESIGHTIGFELFDRYSVEELSAMAADRAVDKLNARPAPSGEMPVVIAAGIGGVLFHEACGHGLESDLVHRSSSVYADRIGQLVASPLVTIIDDGTYQDGWGQFAIDDEGHKASKNVLIQDGVLTAYMCDWMRTHKYGDHRTGNGRRESYDVLPMVRMTNTYLGNGKEDPEEIIRQTKRGVYVSNLGGGQVNITTGDFVFGMTEGFLIEDGKLTTPLREANLIGNGPKVLSAIDAMGNDFSMGFPGTCGKDGQGVAVGMGTPTLRVAAMTVGGTANG